MTFRRAIGACMFLGLFVGAPVSCLIETETPQGLCKDKADACDDKNACTKDICGDDGWCAYENLAAPGPEGCPADNNPCTKEACSEKGECTNVPDNELVPDDGNDCTTDTCTNAQAKHVNKPDDTACGLGGAIKCKAGKCVCANAAQCGTTTACVTFACEDNACAAVYEPKNTAVDEAMPDDCKKNVCDGAGQVISAADTDDFPADPTPNDCKKKGCNNDAVDDVPDMDDLPLDDMNVCTTEGCNADGTVLMSNVADGVACGAAQACASDGGGGFQTVSQPKCNGAGVCAGGNATSCGLFVCNGSTDCRTDCTLDSHCLGTAFCGAAACITKLDNAQPCAGDNQCKSDHCVDGVCCNATCGGTCESCKLNGKVGTCNKMAINDDPDNECPGGQTCNGNGACIKPPGDPCGGDSDCISNQCEDGVCCSSDCAGPCQRCDLMNGTCTFVDKGDQVSGCQGNSACDGANNCKKANGQGCGGGGECASNNCIEGVCCDTSCGGLCRSCRGSKTTGGVEGKCDFIKNATDPDNECMGGGNDDCNGAGMCD